MLRVKRRVTKVVMRMRRFLMRSLEREEKDQFDRAREESEVKTAVVTSEEGNTVVKGHEEQGEEVNQSNDGDDHDILVLEDEEESPSKKQETRRMRVSIRMTKILAAKSKREERAATLEAEQEEDEEYPLKMKPRIKQASTRYELSADESEATQTDPDGTDTEDITTSEKLAKSYRKGRLKNY